MYRLKVWFNKHWKWGLVEYNTLEEAKARVTELAKVGIKAKIGTNEELFN